MHVIKRSESGRYYMHTHSVLHNTYLIYAKFRNNQHMETTWHGCITMKFGATCFTPLNMPINIIEICVSPFIINNLRVNFGCVHLSECGCGWLGWLWLFSFWTEFDGKPSSIQVPYPLFAHSVRSCKNTVVVRINEYKQTSMLFHHPCNREWILHWLFLVEVDFIEEKLFNVTEAPLGVYCTGLVPRAKGCVYSIVWNIWSFGSRRNYPFKDIWFMRRMPTYHMNLLWYGCVLHHDVHSPWSLNTLYLNLFLALSFNTTIFHIRQCKARAFHFVLPFMYLG